MVRISTHPTRLLALEYGADYVYSEVGFEKRICFGLKIKCITLYSDFIS